MRRGLVDREGGDDSIGALIANAGPVLESLNGVLYNVQELTLALEDAVRGDKETQLGALLADVDSLVTSLDRIATGRDTGPGGGHPRQREDVDGRPRAHDRPHGDAGLAPHGGPAEARQEHRVDHRRPDRARPEADRPQGLPQELPRRQQRRLRRGARHDQEPGGDRRGARERHAIRVRQHSADSRRSSGHTENVLQGLENNPLLRGGITVQKSQPPTFSSSRDGSF